MNMKALLTISYGIYVIGSKNNSKLNGQISNTVFQVTSQPPTIAVSINKSNLTHEYIQASKIFTVSVLCQTTPISFIRHFGFKSGRELDKLEKISYKIGNTGAPIIIENAASYFEVKVVNEVDVGSHTIFIGEIVDAEVLRNEECMTYNYYRQVKRGSTPKSAPSYIREKNYSPEKPKYRCTVCGYIYDPEIGDPDGGIPKGTTFEELPDDWKCPVCGASKIEFEIVE
jgi:flavin reductase (DIM6/NTAB) family NADH-FMN oxidoreductase RutF/rubredoxin